MELHSHNMPNLELSIAPGTVPLFATILQSGIAIETRSGETLGAFLNKLCGFTRDYIIDEIQTIFLNGTAIDDLETPLAGDSPVLALSAAMPGLAGAIFRKNSFHAALRTASAEQQSFRPGPTGITLSLKLFNSIARDRGPALLAQGVSIQSANLQSFFTTNPALLDHLRQIALDGKEVSRNELTAYLKEERFLKLTVREGLS